MNTKGNNSVVAPMEQSSTNIDTMAISIEDITVAYRSYKERPTTLKESLVKFARTGKIRYYSTFNALENISFQVQRGEVFGIIGSNGAGKSTLLRVLSGVLPPVQGTLTVNGSVDSLIQLGAGFDSELNAVENIFLSGSLHRRSRTEMAKRVEPILDFAELKEFAETPIKYYSSGMFARLGFSVAIDRDPDILLVDEVLAVGDERFQEKCRGVFQDYLNRKKTIVMVSHSLEAISKLATRIALLSKGRIVFCGDPKEAVKRYRDGSYEIALDGHRL